MTPHTSIEQPPDSRGFMMEKHIRRVIEALLESAELIQEAQLAPPLRELNSSQAALISPMSASSSPAWSDLVANV